MNKNILLCGVGGQGIVLTSKLIAHAAMQKNIPVMSAETIGMAQKGGSVFSFLRMGENLHCPMFTKKSADLLIGFEPAEAVRMLPYVKDEGFIILNSHPVMPVSAALQGSSYDGSEMIDYLKKQTANLTIIDGEQSCREIGSSKVLNMIMLGAAIQCNVLPVSMEDVEESMRQTVKPKFHDLNSRALHYMNEMI